MNLVEKELLFKSWSKVNEITLIKVVASRGHNVNLCLEFLSHNKQIPPEDAFEYFHEVVDTYIYRLLSDKSMFKAQQVLKNVSRDYKSIYYQFALESTDESLKNSIFDYLRKDNSNFEDEKKMYMFYLAVLKEIKNEPKLSNPIKRKLKIFNLETFFKMDKKFQKNLVIGLYLHNKNDTLVDYFAKENIWEYFVDENIEIELVLWCRMQKGDFSKIKCKLHQKYSEWKIDNKMFSYALKYLKSSNEELRDLFLFHGYIFDDEKNDAKKISNRIIRTKYTHTLDKNIGIIKSLPVAEYLVENNCLAMLLQKFIQIDDIENLKSSYLDKVNLFDLIIALKSFDSTTPENCLEIFQACKTFLSTADETYLKNHPLFVLAEFLISKKDIKSLQNIESIEAGIIKTIPFVDNLSKQIHGNITQVDAIELFMKKTGINLEEIQKSDFSGETVSFSNSKMIAKHEMKFELNYTHFIRQERSSYAVYKFLIEQLTNYGQINKSQFYCAVEIVSEIALSAYTNLNLIRHCVIFIEQLGFDSQNLRCLLRVLRMCDNEQLKNLDYQHIIKKAEEKLLGDHQNIASTYKNSKFPIEDYSALVKIAAFSEKHYWPQKYMNFVANKNDWFKLLLFLQYFQFPVDIIKNICKHFKIFVAGENFFRAVTFEGDAESKNDSSGTITASGSKRRASFKRTRTYKTDKQQKMGNDVITAANTSNIFKNSRSFFKSNNGIESKCLENRDDIFALIILSTTNIPEEKITSFANFLGIINDSNSYSTSFNLLKRCIKYNFPILSVLSAEAYNENVDWCWLIWLSISTDNFKKVELSSSEQMSVIVMTLIESIVKQHFILTLHRSYIIFYDNDFVFLLKFLELTKDLKFTEECSLQLKSFLCSYSNNEIKIPFAELKKEELIIFVIRILLLHVKYNFGSQYSQLRFLQTIVQSGITEFNYYLDFDILTKVFELVMGTEFYLNFESIMPTFPWKTSFIQKTYNEYKSLLNTLLESKKFDKGIKLGYLIENLLDKPISNIIFTKWITELDLREINFDFEIYEKDAEQHCLPPEFLVNFYLYAAIQFQNSDFRRYLWYKNALEVIKRHKLFSNESIDRDQIEFDMIMVFLKSDKDLEDFDIYHSDYYEAILSKERFVLYKSFIELKELAGVEDLKTTLKIPLTPEMKSKLTKLIDYLLDVSDIIETLRLQAMFEHTTVDLSYLVFCMALAEGLTTINNLTEEERYLFTNAEKSKTMFSKKTLEGRKIKGQEAGSALYQKRISESKVNYCDFEDIPSKEKQQILDTLQGLTASLKYGGNIGKRIVLVFRAAMYIDKEYTDILRTKDISTLLVSAISEDCLKKLLVVNDIFTSSQMNHEEIAVYLSHEITTAIVRPLFYILTTDQKNIRQIKPTMLWGYDLEREFHLILEICPKPSLLGEYLLKYCDILNAYRRFQNNEEYEHTSIFESFYNILKCYGLPSETSVSDATQQVISYKKKNTIYIELLIVAYKCFVHECHMEGMINVLNRAQNLNSQLEQAKSWKLICRMLTGIGQYREMSYCFDTLIKNNQFESLLGAQYDDEKSQGLKYAILLYLREFYPNPQEYITLVAKRFSMYTEIAEMWVNDANIKLSQVISEYQIITETKKDGIILSKNLKCCLEAVKKLEEIRDCFAIAAENYLFDEKHRLAAKIAQMAQLIAMQIGLLNYNLSLSCCGTGGNTFSLCVINVKSKEEFRELVNNKLDNCFQAMILTNSYPEYSMQWHEVLLRQYVISNHENYLEEFCCNFELTDAIIENIVIGFQNYSTSNFISSKMEENLEKLVNKIKSIRIKYHLASHMSFKKIITNMLNDDKSIYYLKDTNYGTKEIVNDG